MAELRGHDGPTPSCHQDALFLYDLVNGTAVRAIVAEYQALERRDPRPQEVGDVDHAWLVDTSDRVGTFVDFTFTEDQDSLRGLVAQIFDDHATPARTKAIEDAGHPFDTDLWSRLASAELLGLCLPEQVGGGGSGLMELGIVLEEAGRHVARVPPSVPALGTLPLARFGGRITMICCGRSARVP